MFADDDPGAESGVLRSVAYGVPAVCYACFGRPWQGDKVALGRVDGGGLQPAAVCSYWSCSLTVSLHAA